MLTPAEIRQCYCGVLTSVECIKNSGELAPGFYCELARLTAIVSAAQAWKAARERAGRMFRDGSAVSRGAETSLSQAENALLLALTPSSATTGGSATTETR